MRKTFPLRGATRVVRRFLWLPLTMCVGDAENYEWRWLEFANIKQEYFSGKYGTGWEDQEFVPDP